MGYGITLRVWGDYACYTRPEMKSERVSYDVMTPSAARGVLESIHWKPSLLWIIDRIHVVNPIRFENIRRNEVKSYMSSKKTEMYATEERVQRASLVLKNVEYIIEAHFVMTDRRGEEDTPEKHYNIFLRRAQKGQCFHRPYLGCREFPAHFELLTEPFTYENVHPGVTDLGYMLHDQIYHVDTKGKTREVIPYYFRAKMMDSVIEIPRLMDGGVLH